jgi:hypothetical protein
VFGRKPVRDSVVFFTPELAWENLSKDFRSTTEKREPNLRLQVLSFSVQCKTLFVLEIDLHNDADDPPLQHVYVHARQLCSFGSERVDLRNGFTRGRS